MAEATKQPTEAAEEHGQLLTVRIISPREKLFEGKATFVSVPGSAGILGIMPQHTKTVTLLRKGDLVVTLPGGGQKTIAVEEGVCEVNRTTVSVFIFPPIIPHESPASS